MDRLDPTLRARRHASRRQRYDLPPPDVPAAMALMSVITSLMYAHDKKQAIDGGWRVREASLHFAELLGGWPSALVAQNRLRHKTSKSSYQSVLWCIVFLFQLAAVDVISGHQLSRWVLNQGEAWRGGLSVKLQAPHSHIPVGLASLGGDDSFQFTSQ